MEQVLRHWLGKRWASLLIVTLMTAPGLTNCAARPQASSSPSPSVAAAAAARVVFAPADQPEATVTVEIAATQASREQGLMNRTSLADDRGMIFVMPGEGNHSFWMKNTLIPLDMIFVSGARKVVGIVANAEPLTLTIRSVGAPSSYVVEVNGGYAAAHHIAAGTGARFVNVPAPSGR